MNAKLSRHDGRKRVPVYCKLILSSKVWPSIVGTKVDLAWDSCFERQSLFLPKVFGRQGVSDHFDSVLKTLTEHKHIFYHFFLFLMVELLLLNVTVFPEVASWDVFQAHVWRATSLSFTVLHPSNGSLRFMPHLMARQDPVLMQACTSLCLQSRVSRSQVSLPTDSWHL